MVATGASSQEQLGQNMYVIEDGPLNQDLADPIEGEWLDITTVAPGNHRGD